MLASAGSSLGLFAVLIGFACLASSALVTDAMLRASGSGPRRDGSAAEGT